MTLFVTGTDTGAGKTHVASALLRALNAAGRRAVGFKPVACGDRLDAEHLRVAGADPALGLHVINPVFFRSPLSPAAAGLIEGKSVDFSAIDTALATLEAAAEVVLVEGAGGWLVPLEGSRTFGDWVAEKGWPVVLVVNNRLGALNHTLLTLEAIRSRGVTCRGLILNHVADERDAASISNKVLLERLTDVPVIADVLHGDDAIDVDLALFD